jgi:hypothetical protein
MPQWYFFAFPSQHVAKAILEPVQGAIRNRDLPAWHKIFDLLKQTPYPPRVSLSGTYDLTNYTLGDGCVASKFAISRDRIPEESDFGLRRTLQTLVEFVSPHRIKSKRTRVSNAVIDPRPWDQILSSQEDREEMQLFRDEIIVRRNKLPDPFWCLESNDAADTNYANPETVARMAEVESTAGLFRRLVRRTDLDKDLHSLTRDLAAAAIDPARRH